MDSVHEVRFPGPAGPRTGASIPGARRYVAERLGRINLEFPPPDVKRQPPPRAGIVAGNPRAAELCAGQGFTLPEAGRYAVGMLFLPLDADKKRKAKALIERILAEDQQPFLGFRPVKVNPEACGWPARESMPAFEQVFIGVAGDPDQESFERKLYLTRRRIENAALAEGLTASAGFYICSFSSRTVVYKGLLVPYQFPRFFADLADPRMKSGLALVHSRFSTNTFPSWPRAHPYRYIVHNGEINTLRGNVNWMNARERQFKSEKFGDDMKKVLPVLNQDGSEAVGRIEDAADALPTARRLAAPAE